MEFGTLLLMLGLAYGLGLLWYELLPGKVSDRPWRVAAYPFVGMFVAMAILPGDFRGEREFGGIYFIASGIGSLVAVIVDWIIVQARHPSVVPYPEPRTEARPAS